MKTRPDSHCGLYCGSCLIMLAQQRGKLETYARMWKVTPEDLACSGCRSEHVSKLCSACTIRDCAREKGIGFCIECGEYPCNHYLRLKELSLERSHLRLQPGELERVRELGIKRWLAYHEKRWSCPECGETFAWYEEECYKCGAVVRSAVDEVAELGLSEYPLDV